MFFQFTILNYKLIEFEIAIRANFITNTFSNWQIAHSYLMIRLKTTRKSTEMPQKNCSIFIAIVLRPHGNDPTYCGTLDDVTNK